MSKLTNMKLPKEQREKQAAPSMVSDQPVYPYGLSLNLDEAALAILGLDELPKVDGEHMVIAKVKVTAVSSNEHSGGRKGKHKHRSVSLQITDMCLEAVPAAKDMAEQLYEKKA